MDHFFAKLAWSIKHPLRALRHLRYRDLIDYNSIAQWIPESPVILEAGAANGINTEEMAEFWPNASPHAFEPVPSARRELDLRVSKFENRVNTYSVGIGSQSGTFELNLSGTDGESGTQSSSLLKPTGHLEEHREVKFENTIKVDITTIDQWALEHKVEHIDFMWLDLQGMELQALSGAERMLQKVKALHIEVQHRRLYDGAPLYPEVKEWLGARGFVPKIDASARVSGNVLFVRT